MDVKVDKHYTHIRIKGQGLGDDLHRSNEEVREAIKTMSADLGLQQSLEVRLLPLRLRTMRLRCARLSAPPGWLPAVASG